MSQHPEAISPLAVIREKERALEKEIRTAQERADARIAQARARADAIKAQAERDGVSEAEKLYQEGIARARTQAGAIEEHGEADAVALRDAGRAKIQQAVEYIVQFVLPKNDEKEN